MPSPADRAGQGERRGEAALGHVPERHGRIAVARRGQPLAVGSERQGRDRYDRSAERGALGPGGDVPEPDGAIGPAAGQDLAVGGERDGQDRPGVTLEDGEGHADRHVPDGHQAIGAAVAIVDPSGETEIERTTLLDDDLKVRTGRLASSPNKAGSPPAVASDRPSGVNARTRALTGSPAGWSRPCRVAVSQSLSAFRTRADGERGQDLAVGREGNLDILALNRDGIASLPTPLRVPELDDAGGRGRREHIAIGRDRQGSDLRLDARERPRRELVGHIPELELAVAPAAGQCPTIVGHGQRRDRPRVRLGAERPAHGRRPHPTGGASRRPRR